MSKLYTLALIFILFSCDSRRIVSNDDTIFVDYDKEQIFDWNNTILIKSVVSLETADVIANAMKDWAIEKGATHYSHWFQPLTGATAEKHDAFL